MCGSITLTPPPPLFLCLFPSFSTHSTHLHTQHTYTLYTPTHSTHYTSTHLHTLHANAPTLQHTMHMQVSTYMRPLLDVGPPLRGCRGGEQAFLERGRALRVLRHEGASGSAGFVMSRPCSVGNSTKETDAVQYKYNMFWLLHTRV